MTPIELEKSELNFDRLKYDRKNFISHYGKDAEKVMRSVATKQAKNMDKNKIKEMVKAALTVPKQEEINSESYLSSRKPMKEVSNPTDTIKMDVPLFIRMLEYAREDAKTDMDLHDVTETATSLSSGGKTLTMSDYDTIVGGGVELDEKKLTAAEKRKKEEIVKGMKKSFKGDEGAMYAIATAKAKKLAEDEISEAYVPDNIKSFAKRKGISSLVNKVAGWAEKVGTRITGGTAIGKDYSTLILDMGYQTADIYINTDDETIELYGEEVNSFPEFKEVYMENQMEHDEDESGLKEGLPKGYWSKKIPGGKMEESYKTLVNKIKKQGKSEKASKAIAGAIASYKAKGGGSGPTAKQKESMAETIMSKLKGKYMVGDSVTYDNELHDVVRVEDDRVYIRPSDSSHILGKKNIFWVKKSDLND
jgi:hypothetical protein